MRTYFNMLYDEHHFTMQVLILLDNLTDLLHHQ